MNFFLVVALPDVVLGIDLQQKFAVDADETIAQGRRQIFDAQRRAVILVLQRLKRLAQIVKQRLLKFRQFVRVFAPASVASPLSMSLRKLSMASRNAVSCRGQARIAVP